MNRRHEIPQAGAEMLLNYFYPELLQRWTVDDKGSFYRNYNHDVLALYIDEGRVELSRDGFLKLLPEGLITGDTHLKGKDVVAKLKTIERRRHLLSEAFLPFDTFAFRQRLEVERHLSALLNDKLEYLLKTYFNFDLAAEQNPYVREVAVMLPFVKQWRGDFGFLRNLLASVFDCEVDMTRGIYSESDTTRHRLPMVRYDLLISGLTAGAYAELAAGLQPLADFVSEWLIPMEVVCKICIKEHGRPQQTGRRLLLSYNTELNTNIQE